MAAGDRGTRLMTSCAGYNRSIYGMAIAGLITAGMSLAAYVLFIPAVVYWLDGPEFIAAAGNLGIAHPPGHPAALIPMKLFMLLPAGDAAFRANLFSAFFGAVSAGLVACLSFIAVAGRRSDAWASVVAIASGLMFGLCRSAFIQAMAVEVYTLNTALVLGALVVVMAGPLAGRRPDDARNGVAAGVLLGLALANHHYLAVLAIPALVAAFWCDSRSVRPLAVVMFVTACTTIAAMMYLPIRSAAGAWPSWAAIDSVGDFLWYASATIFSQSVGAVHGAAQVADKLPNGILAFVLVGESLGPIVPVMALGGLYLMARLGFRRVALVLFLLGAGGFASKVVMGITDPSNPDDHGYFMALLAALAIAAPQLLVVPGGDGHASRRFAIPANLVALVLVAFCAVGGFRIGSNRQAFDHTDRVADIVWDSIPQSGIAFISHYPVFFLMQYGQEIEGRRPDVTLVQQSLYSKSLGGRDYAAAIGRRDPGTLPLVDAFIRDGTLSWPLLVELARKRPVMIEPSPDLDAVMEDLHPSGWLFSMSPGRATAEIGGDARLAVQRHIFALRSRLWAAAADNVETRRVAVRNLAASAEWSQRAGLDYPACDLLLAALELNPRDRAIRARLDGLGGGRCAQ
ncbi:MAG TPA: DUF2723 domain-containing protein [Myxococcota bacterium]|nr:DUF2723 domain-containing protein [Myxococcota bacterium]